MKDIFATLDSIVQSCGEELFPWSSLSPMAEDDKANHKITAVIGFAGDNFKGALGLTASTKTIVATLPNPVGALIYSSETKQSLDDWIAELANQLLGRIKARLIPYGIEAWLSEPVVLRGLHVCISPRLEEGVRNYSFSGKFGLLWVWMDLRASPEFELNLVPELDENACAPGDIMLF